MLTELRPVPVLSHPSAETAQPATLALADRFSTLIEVGRLIASVSAPEAVYDAVQEAAMTILRGDQCRVFELAGGNPEDLFTVSGEDADLLSHTVIRRPSKPVSRCSPDRERASTPPRAWSCPM